MKLKRKKTFHLANEINLHILTGVEAENELFKDFSRDLMKSVIVSQFVCAVATILSLITGIMVLNLVKILFGIFRILMMCTKN